MTGRVVIVTGASRGIGLEACRRFVDAGDRVGLIGRDAETLAATAITLGGTTAVAAADVADVTALTMAITSVESTLGPCDVLVNNAGIGAWGAVLDTDAETFRRMIDVNYLGTVYATAAVLPGMLERGRGRVVNVASIAGRIGAPFEAAYSASKFAVVGYSEALAIELAGTGVTVSLVDPGPVATDFFDRRGHPYELSSPRPIAAGKVADAIVKAARRGTPEQYLPRWLRGAHAAAAVAPALSRIGTRRMFSASRAALRARLSSTETSTTGTSMEHR